VKTGIDGAIAKLPAIVQVCQHHRACAATAFATGLFRPVPVPYFAQIPKDGHGWINIGQRFDFPAQNKMDGPIITTIERSLVRHVIQRLEGDLYSNLNNSRL